MKLPAPAPDEVGRRVVARLRAMTPAEFRAHVEGLGIVTPEGELTSAYGGTGDEP